MTSLAIAPSTSTTLPAVSFHPHGHKKSSQVGSDADNDTAAQIPTSAAQSIFGNLMQTLESVIGVQTSLPASASAAVGASTSATGTTSAPAAASATTSAAATTTAATTAPATTTATPTTASAATAAAAAKLKAAFDSSAQNLPAGVAQNLKISGANVNAIA